MLVMYDMPAVDTHNLCLCEEFFPPKVFLHGRDGREHIVHVHKYMNKWINETQQSSMST